MDINGEAQAYCCTEESIAAFLRHEQNLGASNDCLRQRRIHIRNLYEWLPQEKEITYDGLRRWRQGLLDQGYSETTAGNYAKNVNRYLDFVGRSDLRFERGRAKDLRGKIFGYLTPVELTGEKRRNDLVWRCVCRCGKEVHLPATRLLTGNTSSCGCMLAEHLQRTNMYIDHTSIRSAMRDQVYSDLAASGYTGVVARRGKWQAYINYKGKRYSLGCYSHIEDAVKARAHAKELVQEDAQKLLEAYQILHQDDRPIPCMVATAKRSRRGA